MTKLPFWFLSHCPFQGSDHLFTLLFFCFPKHDGSQATQLLIRCPFIPPPCWVSVPCLSWSIPSVLSHWSPTLAGSVCTSDTFPQALRPAGTSDSTEEKASCHRFQTWQPRKTPEQSRRQIADKVMLYPESEHFYWNAIVSEFSCIYSASIARYMGACKVLSVTAYDLVKLGYIFTYLAKAMFPTPKAASTLSPCQIHCCSRAGDTSIALSYLNY